MKRFLSQSKQVSFYELLGVKPKASTKEIKAQYFELCKKTHPDTNSHASSKFIQLTEAYNTLKDPLRRREYDRKFEYKTPKPAQPVVPFTKQQNTLQKFWAAQQNQERLEKEAQARQSEDKLDFAVKRNRLLIVGAITFGYILTYFR